MTWAPHFSKPKTACRQCNTTSYIHPLFTEHGLFCSDYCATTFRWDKKWNYRGDNQRRNVGRYRGKS